MKKIIYLNVYKIIMVSLGLVIVLPLIAADTGQINYQARLLDSYGRRVNDTVDLSFKIYDAVTAGNLLWSETQSGVVVQDGVYSVVLGSQTAIPASVFAQNTVYLELGINGETMTPRQQITASAYSLVARTIMGSNVYENQTSGYVGVGTTNPAVKLDVSGTVQATGFKMPTGATANYVLASDASGVGTWQPYSAVVTEHDPIFTNWVQVTFISTTNALNTRVGNLETATNALQVQATALQGATSTLNTATNSLQTKITTLNTATNELNTATNSLQTKITTLNTATNELNTATNSLQTKITTLNTATNALQIQVTANTTGKVDRAGDTMTGALIVSNNLTVALTNGAGTTNFISLGGVAISNWYQVGGGNLTNDIITLQGATGSLNTAVGTLNTATGTLNTATGTLNTAVTTLNTATNELNTATNSLQTKITTLNTATNSLQTKITTLNTATNSLNTRAVSWDNAFVNKTGTAGDTIAYSNLYYFGVNGSWSNASAANSATAGGLLGLALGGNPSSDGMLLNGQCTNAWGFSPGAILYLATNASKGQITATIPTGTNHIVRIVGYAIDSSTIYFNPDRTYIEIVDP